LVREANAIRVPAIGAMENQRVTLIKPGAGREKSLPCGDTMMLPNLQCHDFSRFFLSSDSDVGERAIPITSNNSSLPDHPLNLAQCAQRSQRVVRRLVDPHVIEFVTE
jgi:hypothetical protein